MDDLAGIEIENGGFTYHVIRRIGCWGPTFEFPVYECAAVNFIGEAGLLNRAIKILSRTAAGGMWDAVNNDVNEMLDCFIDPGMPTTLLLFDQEFMTEINNVQNICIVFAFQELMSLRSFVHFDQQRFGRGFTVPQIRRAVFNMVDAVGELHHFTLAHMQLTAGHIVCSPDNIKLAALCTAFELDWHVDPNAQQFLQSNRISDWGRAPENDDEAQGAQPPHELEQAAIAEGDFESQLDYWNVTHSVRRDVWSIGVVALELGYGRIQVINRNQFLGVVNYIQQQGIMPDTWEQLLQNSEAQMPIHGSAVRFPNSYIQFVRVCLQENPYDRPDTQGLLNHDFLGPDGMISEAEFVALTVG